MCLLSDFKLNYYHVRELIVSETIAMALLFVMSLNHVVGLFKMLFALLMLSVMFKFQFVFFLQKEIELKLNS